MNNEEEQIYTLLLKNKSVLPSNKEISCLIDDWEYCSSKKKFAFRRGIDISAIKSGSSKGAITIAIYNNNHHHSPCLLIQEKIYIKSIMKAQWKNIEFFLCWNNNSNNNQYEYIRIEISLTKSKDYHFKRLLQYYYDSQLVLSPKINLQYTCISINLFKFEEESNEISPNTNLRRTMDNILNTEDHSYYFLIKYMHHSIHTKKIFSNEIKSVVYCIIPIINDSNQHVILEFYKDNLCLSYKQFFLTDIIKGLYSSLKYISMLSDDYSWKNNVLISISKSKIIENHSTSKGILFQEQLMEMTSFQECKTKGRTHVWNIRFTIHQINVIDLKQISIKIYIGNESQSLSNERLPLSTLIQYQTFTKNQIELPDIIIKLNSKSVTYLSRISTHINCNSLAVTELKSITHNNNDIKYAAICLKYSLSLDYKPITILLINDNNNKQNKDKDINESDSEIEEESKEDSSLTLKKAYHILLNCFYQEFNDQYSFPEKKGSLKIMINNQVQSLHNISNQIYQTLLFKNCKFDIIDKASWPIVCFEYYNNDTTHISSCSNCLSLLLYSINQREINNNQQWIELYDYYSINEVTQRLLCSIEIFEESNSSLLSSVQSMDVVPLTHQYNLEFISLGFRNINNTDSLFFTIDLNNISIENNISNNRLSQSLNDKLTIKEDITIPSLSNQIDDIIGKVYQYNINTSIKEFIGTFNLSTNEVIMNSHRDIDQAVALIQENSITVNQKHHYSVDANKKDDMPYNNIIEKNGINDIQLEIKNSNSNQQISLSHNNEKAPLIENNNDKINNNLGNANIDIERANSHTRLNNKINKQNQIVVLPKLCPYKLPGTNANNSYYKLFENEDMNSIPDISFFKAIGGLENKHYRRYYNCPLENEETIGLKSPFYKISIDNMNGCYIKAIARIVEKEKYSQYANMKQVIEDRLGDSKREFLYLYQYDNLLKSISNFEKIIIRLYITDIMLSNEKTDNDDPITIETRVYLNNTLVQKRRKDILSRYDIPSSLPGNCLLKIEIWKSEELFGDELIGNTVIDIEDRYFDLKWNELKDKPIETRELNNNNSNQDNISLWVDIHSKKNMKLSKVWDISNLNLHDNNRFQLRLVVYRAELYDTINSVTNETNDLYISASNDNDKQYSDIHYNCNGYAYFNWRFVFDLDYTVNNNKAITSSSIITVKLMDYQLNNEELCIGTFDLCYLLSIAYNLRIPILFTNQFCFDLPDEKQSKDITFSKELSTQFWLNLFRGVR